MKKTILITTILFFTSITLFSQITKEYWLIGGSADYTNYKSKSDESGLTTKYSLTTINTEIGYFVKSNWAVGGLLSYERYDSKEFGYSKVYGMGVFTRYYFLKPEKMYNFFSQVHCTYGIGKYDKTSETFSYGLKLGQVTFLNECIGLEFALEIVEKINYQYDNTTIIKPSIGLQLYLTKK